MNSKIIQSAMRVINVEAEALATMANNLPSDFVNAVKLIKELSGHLVISGIGKSGHVGRKIAATLSSTGTPSFFVHATEASHGDLGSISSKDACLLISNSGESAELKDLVNHTRRHSIPLIGISSETESSLMQNSDFKLYLPKVEEACTIGLAPTTSTTMALALGDAIAVTLMQERNFKTENFKTFHPGGSLGAKVTQVQQIMHTGEMVPIVLNSTPMTETLLEMTSKGFGIAIVVEEDLVQGVITDGDLRRHMLNLMDKTAGDIASANPITITKNKLAVEALALMNKNEISAIIVVDKFNKPIGILHVHDCLRAGLS